MQIDIPYTLNNIGVRWKYEIMYCDLPVCLSVVAVCFEGPVRLAVGERDSSLITESRGLFSLWLQENQCHLHTICTLYSYTTSWLPSFRRFV